MSRLRAYLELFRLPNVFTAIADVLMGYLVTHPVFASVSAIECGLLVLASALLYTAGMVLNDVYDAHIDAAERPKRPIPSGRVSLRYATWLGYELLVVGVACAGLAGWYGGQWRSGGVAVCLAGAVIAYDMLLKKTVLAPLGMGICRFLNVGLGMSATAIALDASHGLIAAGIGAYIVGVTLFSRSEATESSQTPLTLATIVMLAGLGVLAWFPFTGSTDGFAGEWYQQVNMLGARWWILWSFIAASILFRAGKAIAEPSPAHVQTAVKHAIMTLIVLDASVTFAVHGFVAATAVILLLFPARWLGQWIYST